MKVGGYMASAKREPIMGVWGQSPQWGPGAEPLVGVRGQSPPEAESLVACGRPMETAKLRHSLYFANSVHIGLLCRFDVFQKTITVVKRALFCGISVYPPVCNTRTPCPND